MTRNTTIINNLKRVIKKYGSKLVFSLGLGGLLSLFTTELFKMKILPAMRNFPKLHEVLANYHIVNISSLEVFIFIVSIVSIISAPLLSVNEVKTNYSVMGFIILVFVELIASLSVFVQQKVDTLFLVSTAVLSVYLVWLVLDILGIIYRWTKTTTKETKQIDVAKLTFIWAIIAFLLGLMK